MAWCRQAQNITWANVDKDLCKHTASLGRNKLREFQESGDHMADHVDNCI